MANLGDFLISLLRKNQPIQNSDNAMHQLLKFGVGGFFDYLEEFMNITISKIDIFNNNPADDTTELEEKISAGLLKLKGDELRIYRNEKESNVDYRNRLLSFITGNNSILGIINIVSNLLNIPSDSFHITYEFSDNEPLKFGDIVTNLVDNETTNILVSLISEKLDNVSVMTIELPSDSDYKLVYEIVSKMLFIGVKLIVKSGSIVYEGD